MASDVRPRILVVDDERFFREAIGDLLRGEGLPFLTAVDGEQALKEAENPLVGVLILDIQLPDRSGLDVLRELREARPELRVIVLSAHTEQAYVLEALRLGACDYLAKPLHEEELQLAVRRAISTYTLSVNWLGLCERLERLAVELGALVDVEANPQILLARVVEAAARLLDVEKVSLLLREEPGGALRVSAALGHVVPLVQIAAVEEGQGISGYAAAGGEALLVSDIHSDRRFAKSRGGQYQTNSCVLAPLVQRSETFGVLCATDRSDGQPLGAEDLSLLRAFAAGVAPALAGRNELAATEAVIGEAEGQDPDVELARAVCDVVSREVEPAALLRAVLEACATATGATNASIYLLHASDEQLHREAQWEGAGEEDREHLPSDRGLTGSAFASGIPIATTEAENDSRFDAEVDTTAAGTAAPCLIVPLRFRDKSLGVARIFAPAGPATSTRTAEVLAAALSAAVRNVLLYRSLVDSVEELAEARRGG